MDPPGPSNPAGSAGSLLVCRAGQRCSVERGIEPGVLGETAVTAFLVGDDQLLFGDGVTGVIGRQDHGAEAFERAGLVDVVQDRVDASGADVVDRSEGAVRHDLRRILVAGFGGVVPEAPVPAGAVMTRMAVPIPAVTASVARASALDAGTRARLVPSHVPSAPSCTGMDQPRQRTILDCPLREVTAGIVAGLGAPKPCNRAAPGPPDTANGARSRWSGRCSCVVPFRSGWPYLTLQRAVTIAFGKSIGGRNGAVTVASAGCLSGAGAGGIRAWTEGRLRHDEGALCDMPRPPGMS